MKQQVTVNARTLIFGQNEPFNACYVVKSGAVKTVHVNERGDEKLLGFYLPGEMFGLEGIVNGVQACSAVALDRTILCKLNFRKLEAIGRQLPALQHWLLQSMSRELNSAERMTRWLSYSTAEERVVGFLLDVSARMKRRHLVHHQFRLAMARTDIANFLGLAVETVSRVLTRLDRDGVVRVQGRQVELLNLPELHYGAGFEDSISAPAVPGIDRVPGGSTTIRRWDHVEPVSESWLLAPGRLKRNLSVSGRPGQPEPH